MNTTSLRVLGAALCALFVLPAVAAASPLPPAPETPGACRDPWVTAAIREVVGREPNGSGDTGECAVSRYGGGRWSSYGDLVWKVRDTFRREAGGRALYIPLYSGQCSDGWVTQAVREVTGRAPRGQDTRGECAIYHYGGGRWSSYADLVQKVRASVFNHAGVDYSGNPFSGERCFGGVGSKCAGTAGVGRTVNANGTVNVFVTVGSILHDNCCLQNPDGKMCHGNNTDVSGQCVAEWDKAVRNSAQFRWWSATWNPNAAPDLTVMAPRTAVLPSGATSRLFETAATLALRAPAGTNLDRGDGAFCASGRWVDKETLGQRYLQCL